MISPARLRRELRQAGIANAAIDAIWPQWWSKEAEGSVSATAELTYTVARRLGLSPKALLDGSAQFLWRDETKFKKLDARTGNEEAALASFGNAVARCALGAIDPVELPGRPDALTLRTVILSHGRLVDARELITLCWSFGIPVLYLRVSPLGRKRMHAMTVRVGGRYTILLSFESKYLARTAYIVAHEIGHVLLGHLDGSDAILEVDDPLTSGTVDGEEIEADRFALALLTGRENPEVLTLERSYTASQLAHAAMDAGRQEAVDPGVLALCLGHTTKRWAQSIGALKVIPPGEQDVASLVNDLAFHQLNWDSLSPTSQEYLSRILGRESAS